MKIFKKLCFGFLVAMLLLSVSISYGAEPNVNDTEEDEIGAYLESNLIPELEKELQERLGINQDEEEISIVDMYSDLVADDIYALDGEDVSYNDTYIDGNVYLMADTAIMSNCYIEGNIFIAANYVELEDVTVCGSVYILASSTNIYSSKLASIYAYSDTIFIDDETEISNDSRLAGSNIDNSGEVGRNTYEEYINFDAVDSVSYTKETTASSVIVNYVARVIAVLIISIVILGGFPKFTAVNSQLKIRSFVRAFFTGLLELIVLAIIIALLLLTGVIPGYGIMIFIITCAFVILGKIMFMVALAIRMVQNPGRAVKSKAFLYMILLSLIFEAVDLLALIGFTGAVIAFIIDAILAITGFGTFVRVLLSSRKKKNDSSHEKDEKKDKDVIKAKDTLDISDSGEKESSEVEPKEEKLESKDDDKKDENNKNIKENEQKEEKQDDIKLKEKKEDKLKGTNDKPKVDKEKPTKKDENDKKDEKEEANKSKFVISDDNKKHKNKQSKES